MNINAITNSPNFGSNYRFNITSENISRSEDLMSVLTYPEISDNTYRVSTSYPEINFSSSFNVFEKVHISADDSYDEFIESNLTQRNIKFQKQTKAEALDHKNIFNRIVLPEYEKDKVLMTLNTDKVEELFKKQDSLYVSPDAKPMGIPRRYKGVQEFLSTGSDIDATKIALHENKGELEFSILDGRHRFAVMRDMGMKKIKFCLDRNSARLARMYGLTAENS